MQWVASRIIAFSLTAFAAGAVNSIAGGGSLLMFPVLLAAGVDPLTANATNTVALMPGSLSAAITYREHLRGQTRAIVVMAAPSLVGGALGAILLLRGGSAVFAAIVPWLVLGATGLFTAQEAIVRWRAARDQREPDEREPSLDRPKTLASLAVAQLVVATYGGYFGAGIGIAMLAALSLTGMRDIHRMNALKNLSAALINGFAAALFLRARSVDLGAAALMAAAAIVGARAGARLAQRVRPETVRRAVVFIGLAIAAVLFARRLLA